jgi:hypothetical protein
LLAFSFLAVGHEHKGAALPATAQVCVPPPAGLVSWWPGDGNANDIKGSNNGTLVNSATFAAGMVGQAFSFNGSNYVEVPDAPNLDFGPNSPMSIDMWVFRTSTANPMHFIGKRSGCTNISYQMVLDSNGVDFNSDSGIASSHQDLPMNAWTHLAGTFDGTTFRIYVNGFLAGTGTGTMGPITTDPLRIGTSGTCAGFGGLIDEVELFNRALSQAEIISIVDAGAAGKCKVAYDTCLRDSSGSYVLQWSSITGQYKLTRCSDGFMLTGTGTVRLVNSIRTLTDFKTDRRISAGFNTGQLTGGATIYLLVVQGVWQSFRISQNFQTPCLCILN